MPGGELNSAGCSGGRAAARQGRNDSAAPEHCPHGTTGVKMEHSQALSRRSWQKRASVVALVCVLTFSPFSLKKIIIICTNLRHFRKQKEVKKKKFSSSI